MANIEAVIFDMDGTLVDNSPYHRKAWKIFCERYGLTKYTELDRLFGLTNNYILPYFFEKEFIAKADFVISDYTQISYEKLKGWDFLKNPSLSLI